MLPGSATKPGCSPEQEDRESFSFPPPVPVYILWQKEGSVTEMFRGNGGYLLGLFAIALGAGILIAAIFPVGALMFLVAFLLIACGCGCCRRR